jgi:hypothetical protein
MMITAIALRTSCGVLAAIVFAALLSVPTLKGSGHSAQTAQQSTAPVALDDDDIGGIVTGPKGPEAGVWVIAETADLGTKFRKIVVTDDAGRYVVPDLPRASYSVWVRGYGLADSKPASARPGQRLNLQAQPAPTPQAAAAIYPANYWYSLIRVPDKSEFPGTGASGNGIAPAMRSQADWISQMKDGCQLCHQMGNRATREFVKPLPGVHSTVDGWDLRVKSGQRGAQMSGALDRFGRSRAIAMFADWTDRILKGEVPEAPPRPAGVERNVVISQWEWGGPTSYVHDEIAADRRTPTIGARGRVYGVDFTGDALVWVDPVEHTSGSIPIPVIRPGAPSYMPQRIVAPSPYFGEKLIFNNPIHPHNPMMDQRQRVWMTAAVRPAQNPDYCTGADGHPYGRHYPIRQSSRQASVYDPRTGRATPVDTCFATHHLQFAEDKDNTLYFSGDTNVIGWINTRVWDESGDAAKAQGWCPLIVDTNGDGRIGPFTQPNEPFDASRDMRVAGFAYGIIVNPVDGSIWWANAGVPGRIGRLELGSNPPETCRAEVFEPPFDPSRPGTIAGFTPRGVDVDRNGVIWTGLSGGSHLASFDRRKCKTLNGPTATGQHCPEGWTQYRAPGPQMKGTDLPGNADFSYYNWVDQFDTLGLGPNVPVLNGSGSDSLLALDPKTRQFVVLRVPYPLGFYSRGLDGRIDDPKGGWKGRGLWADYGTNVVWHLEGGENARSALVKFQLRPDALAK